jgi:hypothetical protein
MGSFAPSGGCLHTRRSNAAFERKSFITLYCRNGVFWDLIPLLSTLRDRCDELRRP